MGNEQSSISSPDPNSLYKYKNLKWIQTLDDDEEKSNDSADAKETEKCFRVLTFNIWFSGIAQEMRNKALIDLIVTLDVDVVGLQECTKSFLSRLTADQRIQARYWINDVDGGTWQGCWYGVVLLVNRATCGVVRGELIDFETNMGRRGAIVTVQKDDCQWAIGTVHLESMANPRKRRAQLQLMEAALRAHDNALLMGDFNFDATRNFRADDNEPLENLVLGQVMPEFVDAWPAVHGASERGVTFDNQNNGLFPASERVEQMRYDRVMVRSNTFAPSFMKIHGDTPFGDEPRIHISDHFGLETKLTPVEI